ncbi:unnamed protein product, partial [marine sediment metagenome]
MIKKVAVILLACAAVAGVAEGAQAKCLKKAAIATAENEKSAKWYALETMVQAVSWG